RDGRAVKLAPNKDHGSSHGAFCVKGARGLPELTYSPDRLLHPMKRAGARGEGKWTRISWDEALDTMTDRLLAVREQHGPTALCGAVSNAHFSRGVSLALLMRAQGSPNWMMNQDLCGGCRALSDKITGLGINGGEDIDNAACALVVGRNPYAADPIQWLSLKRAQARGGKIIVIDPARTPAADIADLWLRPRVGTDAAIALAMIRVMIAEDLHDRDFVENWTHGFDELRARADAYTPEHAESLTGVPAADIVAAARLYGAGPSCFVSGHGIDASTAGVQTFRAFHCLVAISGNLDREGGNRRVKRPKNFINYIEVLHRPEFRLSGEVEQQTIGAERFPLWAGPEGWQTACHNPSVIEAILTGEPYPVRALYVTGVNIAVTYPDTQRTIRAFKSLDFLAVATHMMNPTAAYADIVLPKTTGLEDEEVSLETSGPCLSVVQPVHPPMGEARSDFDIATEIARRAEARGLTDARRFLPWESKREFNEFLLNGGPITMETLLEDGHASYPFEYGTHGKTGFPTKTGKVELRSERLASLGLNPLPDYTPPRAELDEDGDYPLLLLTGAREKTYHHSRFRDQDWARKVSPDPWAQVHPDTAAAMGLADGDWVRIETKRGDGACRLKVTVTDITLPGVVRTGMGWWYPEAPGPEFGALDVNINGALSYGAPWDPVSGSTDTRGLACRLTRLEAAQAAAE
ncbi:MAG: molybdopterin-dependent oxidoreductase, partial [Alphaproteobacteria bacterium]